MKTIHVKRTLQALACIAVWGASSVAHATSYLIHQGGFNGGGEINLTFEGVDKNNDGQIHAAWGAGGEVTQAFLSFSGNTGVPDFASWLKPHELFLIFKVNQNEVESDRSSFQAVYVTVHPDEGIEGIVFSGYFASIGVEPINEWVSTGAVTSRIVAENMQGPSPQSHSPITISQVPEPGSLLSMALGLATLAVYGRRQSS